MTQIYGEADTVGRLMEAHEIDGAIGDICRIVSDTAIESRLSAQYAPVLGHLVKARRALRDAFDTHPPRPPRR